MFGSYKLIHNSLVADSNQCDLDIDVTHRKFAALLTKKKRIITMKFNKNDIKIEQILEFHRKLDDNLRKQKVDATNDFKNYLEKIIKTKLERNSDETLGKILNDEYVSFEHVTINKLENEDECDIVSNCDDKVDESSEIKSVSDYERENDATLQNIECENKCLSSEFIDKTLKEMCENELNKSLFKDLSNNLNRDQVDFDNYEENVEGDLGKTIRDVEEDSDEETLYLEDEKMKLGDKKDEGRIQLYDEVEIKEERKENDENKYENDVDLDEEKMHFEEVLEEETKKGNDKIVNEVNINENKLEKLESNEENMNFEEDLEEETVKEKENANVEKVDFGDNNEESKMGRRRSIANIVEVEENGDNDIELRNNDKIMVKSTAEKLKDESINRTKKVVPTKCNYKVHPVKPANSIKSSTKMEDKRLKTPTIKNMINASSSTNKFSQLKTPNSCSSFKGFPYNKTYTGTKLNTKLMSSNLSSTSYKTAVGNTATVSIDSEREKAKLRQNANDKRMVEGVSRMKLEATKKVEMLTKTILKHTTTNNNRSVPPNMTGASKLLHGIKKCTPKLTNTTLMKPTASSSSKKRVYEGAGGCVASVATKKARPMTTSSSSSSTTTSASKSATLSITTSKSKSIRNTWKKPISQECLQAIATHSDMNFDNFTSDSEDDDSNVIGLARADWTQGRILRQILDHAKHNLHPRELFRSPCEIALDLRTLFVDYSDDLDRIEQCRSSGIWKDSFVSEISR